MCCCFLFPLVWGLFRVCVENYSSWLMWPDTWPCRISLGKCGAASTWRVAKFSLDLLGGVGLVGKDEEMRGRCFLMGAAGWGYQGQGGPSQRFQQRNKWGRKIVNFSQSCVGWGRRLVSSLRVMMFHNLGLFILLAWPSFHCSRSLAALSSASTPGTCVFFLGSLDSSPQNNGFISGITFQFHSSQYISSCQFHCVSFPRGCVQNIWKW